MITSLTGRADGFDLVFENREGRWEAVVPPDLSDGKYVVTLRALGEGGKTSFYRGVLYLCAGVSRLEVKAERFSIALLSDRLVLKLGRKRG